MTVVYLKQMTGNDTLYQCLSGFIAHLKRRRVAGTIYVSKQPLCIGHDAYENRVLKDHLVMLMLDINSTITDLEQLEREIDIIDDKEYIYKRVRDICDCLDKHYPWE